MIKEMNILVFIDESVDNIELVKTIDKYGIILKSEKLEENELIKRLKAIASAYGVKVENDTLRYLIEISGTSMQDLLNEIRKLIEYRGKGETIFKQDVDKLSTKQFDAVIFHLTDNLGTKNIKIAMDVLNELIENKEPLQKILLTLYNHFKKLYITKLASSYNNLAEMLNLKPNQMFLVSKYKKQAQLFEESILRQILEELADLDANYKKGKIDLDVGLKAILCNYCSK